MPDGALTRAEIADAITRMVGLSRNESGTMVESVLEIISGAMAAGQTVKVSSFGAWQVRVKSARQGRNPKTKEPATISERRVLVFRASQLLKKMVNGEKITDQDRNAQE